MTGFIYEFTRGELNNLCSYLPAGFHEDDLNPALISETSFFIFYSSSFYFFCFPIEILSVIVVFNGPPNDTPMFYEVDFWKLMTSGALIT